MHVHVPEGAIPKDGPSVGITMTTTIISAEHMDEVLRHALVLDNPDEFFKHADEVAKRDELGAKAMAAASPAQVS